MVNVALFGAGGKMGCRLVDNLSRDAAYAVRYVETGEAGVARLAERGLSPTTADEALRDAEIVVLALPDTALGGVSHEVIPRMRSGAILMTLDPAAAHAGVLARRDDVVLFVAHPCHPPLWNDEEGDARRDFFGGVAAKQNAVCAMENGTDEDYARAEALVRAMYAPVMRTHRVTVEQMAILEPAMAETVTAMLCTVIKEAMDEAVARGVPPEAAKDFMMGHVNIPLAIVFDEAGNPFSDGAKLIIEYGRERVIQRDWKRVFEPESVREQVKAIVNGSSPLPSPLRGRGAGGEGPGILRLGVSTYAFPRTIAAGGMSVDDLLAWAVEHDLDAVQFCENLPWPLDRPSPEGLVIETGCRGIGPHLLNYLRFAQEHGSGFVRLVIDDGPDEPAPNEAVERLRPYAGAYRAAGVVLGVENHDRFPARVLRGIVEALGLGVVLDTANSLGSLEDLNTVVAELGPYVVNLHAKDVRAVRKPDMLGFDVEGTIFGRGSVCLGEILPKLPRLQSVTLEQWPSAASNAVSRERDWAETSLKNLREVLEER